MDATQTSEPTEAGPGSPGRASAFRRALDEQAENEGPLDLTVPLNIAEVRAALSAAPSPGASARPARTGGGTGVGGGDIGGTGAPEHGGAPGPATPAGRRGSRQASSKRLGRIAVFVAVTAALSVGTAGALVLNSDGQGSSVSLPPTTGNIPLAPTEKPSQQGQIVSVVSSGARAPSPAATFTAPGSGATGPAMARPSPSGPASSTSGTSGASASAGAGAGSSPSPGASGSGGSSTGPTRSPTSGPTSPATGTWVTLYWGIQNQTQEVGQVQSLLADLSYLYVAHRHSGVNYFNPSVSVQPDPDGTYGSATEDAVAEFQQDYGVDFSGQPGTCDYTTYQALLQVSQSSQSQARTPGSTPAAG